jgi:hypothetical protein
VYGRTVTMAWKCNSSALVYKSRDFRKRLAVSPVTRAQPGAWDDLLTDE